MKEFWKKLKELDTEEKKFEALDYLYDKIDNYFYNKDFNNCDYFIIDFLQKNHFSLRLHLGLLTCTSRARKLLKYRKLVILRGIELATERYNEKIANNMFNSYK